MPIVIEGIRCSAHCGVTEAERRQPQPILVDLELQCPNARAAHTDTLTDTVDYGAIVERVTQIATISQYCLVESLAAHITKTLFREFPISNIKAWVRKITPPLDHIDGSVGVRFSQSRSQITNQQVITETQSQPSAFLLEQYPKFSPGKWLDVATGHGRNALYLASQGFSVVGVDRNEQALEQARKLASELHQDRFTTHTIDLEANPSHPPDLGKEAYDGILVFFYLYRPLFPKIVQALKPGGYLIYETFLIDNHTVRNHPRNKDFCLEHNELLKLAKDLRILNYQEGEHQDSLGHNSAYTARLVAMKK